MIQTRLSNSASGGDREVVLEDVGDIEIGDKIMITATLLDPTESEVVTVSGVSGNTVSLTSGLVYNHPINDYITCEVSLLSRNIVIRGVKDSETWDDVDAPTNFIGGRVLVGQTQFGFPGKSASGYNGYGRFNNVQFSHLGQYNKFGEFDPRHALSYLMAGNVNELMPSEVINCAFHDGFGAGIAVFQTNNLVIRGNTVHKTIQHSLKIEGQNCVVEDNIFAYAMDYQLYQTTEVKIDHIFAAVDIMVPAENVIFNNNVVVGSDRAGVRFYGQPCSTNATDLHYGNIVRSCQMGLVADTYRVFFLN